MVIHCAAAVLHRFAAFLDGAPVRAFYTEDAERVLAPVRLSFVKQRLEAK